jgi:hypothetical protein
LRRTRSGNVWSVISKEYKNRKTCYHVRQAVTDLRHSPSQSARCYEAKNNAKPNRPLIVEYIELRVM